MQHAIVSTIDESDYLSGEALRCGEFFDFSLTFLRGHTDGDDASH